VALSSRRFLLSLSAAAVAIIVVVAFVLFSAAPAAPPAAPLKITCYNGTASSVTIHVRVNGTANQTVIDKDCLVPANATLEVGTLVRGSGDYTVTVSTTGFQSVSGIFHTANPWKDIHIEIDSTGFGVRQPFL